MKLTFDDTAVISTCGPCSSACWDSGGPRIKNCPRKTGKNCSASCPTKDHLTFGECMRAKNLHLNPNLADTGRQKAWDKELDAYDSARRQGVEPEGTTMKEVDKAMRKAEALN